MNKKFLPGAVLFIIAFVLSNLASLAQVKAGLSPMIPFTAKTRASHMTTGDGNSGFGFAALFYNTTGDAQHGLRC